ncbi:hypothetical protein QL989_15925 [Pseudoalteromonas sp. APC 3224]|uniref:hypothetical protein n=1 Tax=Pseudoalteromonas sp. APC 3224 TaxID=3035203 RepID=UPI0025B2B77A|nr:hypothetical protein [Pseudoalteromonas sp. APC 3224]MDN3486833.1 hypothetical protein [Pseudoalteromonas sp. APC 3224]
MIRVLLILFLISLSTHYAKANELNVSINSYSDAAAYIQAAYDNGLDKKCWDSNATQRKVVAFLGSEGLDDKHENNLSKKSTELKPFDCNVLASVIDMVHSNKNAILTKYPKNQKTTTAPDWNKLPSNNPVFYSQNGGSKAILSINDRNSLEISLLTVNSSCDLNSKSKQGESFMYVNKTLVKFGYVCNGEMQSIFFAKSQKGKEYILKEFEDKSKVCYALKEEIKGLCFGAIGFKSSKRELLNIMKQRDAAI